MVFVQFFPVECSSQARNKLWVEHQPEELLYIDPYRPTKNHKMVEQLGKLVVFTKPTIWATKKRNKKPLTFHEILVV